MISRLRSSTIKGLHHIDKNQKTLLQETRKLVLRREFESIIASILVNTQLNLRSFLFFCVAVVFADRQDYSAWIERRGGQTFALGPESPEEESTEEEQYELTSG